MENSESTNHDQLPMWVVYDHPSDYPNEFVARLWLTLPEGKATHEIITAPTLDAIREKIMAHSPWMIMLQRMPDDDAKIVETWL